MATKPSDNPLAWATTANYDPAGVYPALFPWGLYPDGVNPNAGMNYPWNSTPRRDAAAAYSALASEGLTPLKSTPAQAMNEHLARVTDLARWVFEGSSAGAADAHIVETDASGNTAVQAISAATTIDVGAGTILFDVAGGSILFGAIPIADQANMVGGALFNGSTVTFTSGDLTSDASSTITWNGDATFNGPIIPTLSTLTADGYVGQSATDYLLHRRGGTTRLIHESTSGPVRATGVDVGPTGPAATFTLDTTVAVAPQAGTVVVEGIAWVQRSLAGAASISLEDGPAFGTIGTVDSFNINALNGSNDWDPVPFVRTITPGTTPKIYRFKIQGGGGQTVTVRNARIKVVPITED